MAGFVPCSALLFTALAAAPSLPAEDGSVPAVEPAEATTPQPTPDRTAEPTPEPAPDPTPTPTPDPEPAKAVDPMATPINVQVVADCEDDGDDDKIAVETYEPGLWGMQFTFGGLAPMSVGGVQDIDANRLMFTELGFRRVLKNDWALLFGVGAGLFRHNPEDGDTQNDVGLSVSYGFLHWFRTWRRIAPYAAGRMRVSYAEPTGTGNWNVQVGLGPALGIEYFVGHRVSLSMQGEAQLGFSVFPGLVQTQLATRLEAGGQMGLNFYF